VRGGSPAKDKRRIDISSRDEFDILDIFVNWEGDLERLWSNKNSGVIITE
jgi:hypothetical protein